MKRKRRTRPMVQERKSKMKQCLTSLLPDDLMFKILLLLPLDTILKITRVCKSWKKIIKCAQFVEAYNNKVSCAIYLRQIQSDKDTLFSRRGNWINLLEIEHGKSKIIDLNISCLGSMVAICNGLILISSLFKTSRMINDNVSGVLTFDRWELIIMNPMTRKFVGFPSGTCPSDPNHSESYGLVFSHLEGVYKVVHLFKDELAHIGCEVWSTDKRYWRTIDGPSKTVSQFSRIPICASGALHWLPTRDSHNPDNPIDYTLSMGPDDERFFTINLPVPLSWNDKVLEMGGVLSLVRSLENIEIWMLKALEGGSEWIKQHNIRIDTGYAYHFKPVFAVNAKEMIFLVKKELYSYDFEAKKLTEIEMEGGSIGAYEDETLMPFTCSLATWELLEPM